MPEVLDYEYLDPYEGLQSNRMIPEPFCFWRIWFLSYVVHFATYGHFSTQKVTFDHEGVELELEYFSSIYLGIFPWILHIISSHLIRKDPRVFFAFATVK